jgi:hypothetical protein|tara:strand:- start:66 stop:1049 length:984 start_codon:yes stop_codon:yes gene_type:complete
MKYTNLALSILLLLAVGFLYNKFQLNVEKDDKIEELNIIKKYLLNEHDYYTIDQLSAIKKPIIWIHIEYDRNLRKWESFGTRASEELNQDYLYLTLRSIIDKCSDYFHVILIDDDSFDTLLEDWNVDLKKVGNVQKENIRCLALMKVLYKYGGILMEPSFILFKTLRPIYEKIMSGGKPCVGEFQNETVDSHIMNFSPSLKFMGCIKNCPKIYELGKHLEILVNSDNTYSSKLEGQVTNWLYNKSESGEINYIDGKFLGTRDSKNKNIDLASLMGSSYLDLNIHAYGLYIPRKDLQKRTAYNWFIYLNTKEVLESNTNVGKYLLISN